MYERFFGLADAPFRLTPDPRYLFLSRKHAEALAHLKLGLRESSGFVCITGDVGTGKTTLLRAFLRDLGPDVATAYVFNPPLTALELLKTINGELGLPATAYGRKRLVDALNAHLLAQHEAGRRSIVVIDEAQTLPLDVLEQLRLLSNLETTTEKLLRIVLVGQPQLRALLLHPDLVQLNQRITLRWHMGPLTRRETAAYITHRLTVASGGPPPRVFTRAAVRLMHRISGGVPRLINMLAHRSMLAAFAAERRVVSARRVRQAYHEIGALPLAASAPRRTAARGAAWAAAAVAAAVAIVAVGIGHPGGWSELRLALAPSPPAAVDVGAAPVPAPVSDPTPAPPAAPVEAVATPAPDTAPPSPTPAAAPAETASPPQPGVEERLAALDAPASLHTAVSALLGAWHVRELGPSELATLNDLPTVAQRRGLEHLPLVGNVSMLRLLDLPAVLALRVTDGGGTRYVALTAMGDGRLTLLLDGGTVPVDAAFLERHWFGEAHLLWRDFESLGPAFGRDGHGPPVARLQALLRGVGTYRGPVNGVFDGATESAVLAFQRSRFLDADGRVGRLTRIVLYDATGGYPRPTLGATS
jgi:general secretion pathway protein A